MPNNSVALLPTRTNVNPMSPDGAEYVETRGSLVLVRNERNTLTVINNHGAPTEKLGDKFVAHHDQAGYTFGELTVVGLVYPLVPGRGLRETVGEVPNRKLAMRVYK